jgi:hypothetical protein
MPVCLRDEGAAAEEAVSLENLDAGGLQQYQNPGRAEHDPDPRYLFSKRLARLLAGRISRQGYENAKKQKIGNR